MTMTHQEARALLQKSMEVQLRREEAAALDAHLAACEPCQAYSRNLGRLHQRLAVSLPARWIDLAPASRRVEQNFQNIEARIRRKRMRQRFLAIAQPVLWTSGLALLTVGLIALLGAVRPGTSEPQDETATPSPSPTPAETDESTAPTGGGAPEATGTFAPCIAQIAEDTEVYPSYEASGAPLGILPAGETVEVRAMVYVSDPEPWLQISFQGETGYILSTGISADGDCGMVPTVIVDPPPAVTPTATDTPQNPPEPDPPTATPSAMPPGTACQVAPAGSQLANFNVYAGPSMTYPVIGTLDVGQYVEATGIYAPGNYETWVQVDYYGSVGWVPGMDYMFDGAGCWPLPQATVENPPPTWTASPYTPMPTSTLPPNMDLNKVIYLGGDVGWTEQLTGDLPNGGGGTVEYIGIRVTVPDDEVRMIQVLVQCTGANPGNLRWGYYGSELEWECGRTIESGVSQGGNLIMIALAIPNDGMTDILYTVTATVLSAP